MASIKGAFFLGVCKCATTAVHEEELCFLQIMHSKVASLLKAQEKSRTRVRFSAFPAHIHGVWRSCGLAPEIAGRARLRKSSEPIPLQGSFLSWQNRSDLSVT